jgi:hypothetical protein
MRFCAAKRIAANVKRIATDVKGDALPMFKVMRCPPGQHIPHLPSGWKKRKSSV